MAPQDGNSQVPNGTRAASPGDGIPETIVVFAKSLSDVTQNHQNNQNPTADNQNGAPKADAGSGSSSSTNTNTAGFDIFGFFRNLAESMSSPFLPNYASPYANPTMGRFFHYPAPFYPPPVTFWPCPYPVPSCCCGHVHVKETVVINKVTQGTQTQADRPRTKKTTTGQVIPEAVSVTKNEDKHGAQIRSPPVTETKDSQSGQGSILIPNKINGAKVPTTTPARAIEPRSLTKDAATSPKPSRWDYNPVLVQLGKNWQSEPKFTVIGGASKDPRLQPNTRTTARRQNEEVATGPAPKKLRSGEAAAVNIPLQQLSSQAQEQQQRYVPGPKSKTQSKKVQFSDDQAKPNDRPQRACKAHNRYERNCKLCCDDSGHKY